MADIQDTDLFLVNRSNTSYQVPSSDLMAELQDDDLLLVNRANKSYKITGAEFKGSLSSPPVINTVTLAEDDPEGDRFTSQDFTTTVTMTDNGNPASAKSIRGWVEGSLSGTIATDEITNVVAVKNPAYSSTLTYDDAAFPEARYAFDGSLKTSTFDVDKYGGTFKDLHWNASSYNLSGTLEVWCNDAFPVEVNGTFVKNAEIQDWTDLGTYPSINSLTIKPIGTAATPIVRAIRLNGDILVDNYSTATLTFKTDKNLAKLNVGDFVKQENTTGTINYTQLCTTEIKLVDDHAGLSSIFDGSDATYGGIYTGSYDSGRKGELDIGPLDISGTNVVFNIITGTNATWEIYLNESGTAAITGTGDNASATAVIPGGTLTSIKLVNTTVQHSIGVSFATIAVDGAILVDGVGFEPSGIVDSINTTAKTISLVKSNGTWGPINDGHYVTGPSAAVDNTTKYLNLDSNLNVIGLTDDDSYTDIPGNNPQELNFTAQIKFPAVLDNGQSPDDTLPEGTTIQTEVKAENSAGADTKVSNEVTPIASVGPSATMHGLRFDSARKTSLNRAGSYPGSFTLSAWVKNTGTNRQFILNSGVNANNTVIELNSGQVRFLEAAGGLTVDVKSTASVIPNQWAHIVVAVNTSAATESDRVKIYIDGSLQSLSATIYPSLNQTFTGDTFVIGGESTVSGSYLDSYLSDYYFVDGQALPPETFGADFEGKWGPLDSSVVKANIAGAGGFGTNGFFLPFDPAATGENYSSQTTQTGTWVSGRPISNVFTGELGNPVSNSVPGVNNTNSGTLVFDPPITGTLIEINGSTQNNDVTVNGDTSNKIRLNDSSFTGTLWEDTNVTSLNRLDFVSNATFASYIRAIRVDGKILVDHNNIGVDDSGNDNHFHDENFVLTGNTQDTVTDTPMKNYATLASGTNGNLEATADGTNVTYMGDAGTDYYYEVDGAGAVHTGGSAFNSTNGKVYNFGQQPFAETPTAEGRLFQTWLEWNDVAALFVDNPEHVAKFEAIKDALESYEGDRDAFRAALLARLIADGYTTQEVAVLGL